MRRLAYSAGAVVIILLLLVGVALSRIDADVLSRVGTDQLSRSLGYPVQVGAVSARIWPSPSVLAQDLRVGGDEQSKPFLTASAVRFELGLLAVLSGNAVIEAATLESPTLTLESGPTGPRLPARTTQREAGATLELIRIRGGTLVMGSWKLEDVVADGLRHFAIYHSRPAVERKGDRVTSGDRALLFYYSNRLEGYRLERGTAYPSWGGGRSSRCSTSFGRAHTRETRTS